MVNTINACHIALTYKRKILLKRLETPFYKDNINTWSFFENVNNNNEPFEGIIVRKVEKEIGIVLPSAVLLISLWENYTKNNFYQAELTDRNVNEIKRTEGQELQFFSMKEVEKLSISVSSQKFLALCKNIIEASFTTIPSNTLALQ